MRHRRHCERALTFYIITWLSTAISRVRMCWEQSIARAACSGLTSPPPLPNFSSCCCCCLLPVLARFPFDCLTTNGYPYRCKCAVWRQRQCEAGRLWVLEALAQHTHAHRVPLDPRYTILDGAGDHQRAGLRSQGRHLVGLSALPLEHACLPALPFGTCFSCSFILHQ